VKFIEPLIQRFDEESLPRPFISSSSRDISSRPDCFKVDA
jgi:hypothetical protein